ncbi:MAG: aspartate aminotransferase family protein [Bacteroidetes bacterium]|nr:aspartate aminotransferase family protein [Bacteroidota bacterium]
MINHRSLFLQYMAQTSPAPIGIEITKAEGSFLFDAAGKKYIDLISGITVCSLGHNHPKINAAIKKQVDTYTHIMVYGELIQSPQTLLAQKLSSLLPQNLNCTYFTNSGAEAIDGALKLSRRFTGKYEIVAFKNSYHGSSTGPLSLMSDEYFTSPFKPLLPGVKFLDFNKVNQLENITTQTACVVAEVIKSEEGYKLPSENFLEELSKRCTQTGTLLIFDESQTGMGRTGKMFAFEKYNVVPDVLVLSKALGGGMPLGAFITSTEVMQSLSNNPVLGHITTFGGHPVCCAASLAAIESLIEKNILSGIEEKESIIRNQLTHTAIKNISGCGLMLSLEFESKETNLEIIKQCITNGLFTDWFLFAENKMRITPPLNIANSVLLEACSIITQSIRRVTQEK